LSSKKYLAGLIDLGILGKKEVGAFWIREVKQKDAEEEIMDFTG
jgi:hypothetical protein